MATILHIPLLLLASVMLAWDTSSVEDQSITGSIQEADLQEEDVQQAIDFSVDVYNQENEDLFYSRVLRVLRARKQTVAGVNYYLDLEIGQTICTKAESNLSECAFKEDLDEQTKTFCSFQVYTVPWLHTISMTQYSCHID